MTTFREQVISGLTWTIGGQGLRTIITTVEMIVLARLLLPEDFGLVGMILVFSGFLQVFWELGFASALIQHPNPTEDHWQSVFWLSMGMGAVLALILAGSAPLLVDFYDEPRLLPITLVVSLRFVIGSLNTLPIAMIKRELRFHQLSWLNVLSSFCATILAIVLALMGLGPMSLVIPMLLVDVILNIGTWMLTGWRLQWRFSFSAVRELWDYSINLLGSQTLNYWMRNADNLIIGKVVGSAELGLYTRAYAVMLLPVRRITSVVSHVMFPAMCRIQAERNRLIRVYMVSNRMIAFVAFPAMLGLWAISEPFVAGLFGERWAAMIPILEVLCFTGALQAVVSTNGWVLRATGRTDVLFRWVLINGLVTIASFGVGVRWGAVGVAIAYTVTRFILTPFFIWLTGRVAGFSLADALRNLFAVAAVSVGMAVAVRGAGFILPEHVHPLLRLAVLIPFGGALYGLMVWKLNLLAFRETAALISERLGELKKRKVRRMATAREGTA